MLRNHTGCNKKEHNLKEKCFHFWISLTRVINNYDIISSPKSVANNIVFNEITWSKYFKET